MKKKDLSVLVGVGRLGTVEETAALIVFLASSDANSISGSAIDINGGLYID